MIIAIRTEKEVQKYRNIEREKEKQSSWRRNNNVRVRRIFQESSGRPVTQWRALIDAVLSHFFSNRKYILSSRVLSCWSLYIVNIDFAEERDSWKIGEKV